MTPVIFLFLSGFASPADAARIALGAPVATTDGTVAISIAVEPATHDDVAAVQFDCQYDPSRYTFIEATAGNAVTLAHKTVAAAELASGVVRVVVIGLNQETLASGDVATLYFQPSDATSADSPMRDVALNEVVVSDPLGVQREAVVADPAAATADPADNVEPAADKKLTSKETGARVGDAVTKEPASSLDQRVQTTSSTTDDGSTQPASSVSRGDDRPPDVAGSQPSSPRQANPVGVVGPPAQMLASRPAPNGPHREFARKVRDAGDTPASSYQEEDVLAGPPKSNASASPTPFSSPQDTQNLPDAPRAGSQTNEANPIQLALRGSGPPRPESLVAIQAPSPDSDKGSGPVSTIQLLFGIALVLFFALSERVARR